MEASKRMQCNNKIKSHYHTECDETQQMSLNLLKTSIDFQKF